MYHFIVRVVAVVVLGTNISLAQDSPQPIDEVIGLLSVGEQFKMVHTIAKGDWSSSSADIRDARSTFTAPAGAVIVGHEINWSGHHSSASHVSTRQGGAIGYEHAISASLHEKLKEGFLGGSLTYKGVKLGDANLAGNYAKFLRDFSSTFRFYANTNSSIEFKWSMHTKRGFHGAKIDASAVVFLERVATENEAGLVLEAIKFVIESGTTADAFDLTKSVLVGGKTSAELGLDTEPTQK